MKKIILNILAFLLCSQLYAQCSPKGLAESPKELLRKRVDEPGMKYGNPYTMFVKSDTFNMINELEKIRANLKNIAPPSGSNNFPYNSYADLYKGIWKAANLCEPKYCTTLEEDQYCMHPSWVKNNTIIYVVRLKYDTTSTGKDTLYLMSSIDQAFFSIEPMKDLEI